MVVFAVILTGLMKSMEYIGVVILLVIICGISMIALLATGGLLSGNKPNIQLLVPVHIVVTILAAGTLTSSVWLLLR